MKASKNSNDGNYISVGSWMWMIFVTALPIIGQIMILVWAFVGDNESRKNYFRALLAWFLILLALVVVLAVVGSWPALLQQLQTGTRRG